MVLCYCLFVLDFIHRLFLKKSQNLEAVKD
jgi:hypothetical protein